VEENDEKHQPEKMPDGNDQVPAKPDKEVPAEPDKEDPVKAEGSSGM
jgi:hypothetical protein